MDSAYDDLRWKLRFHLGGGFHRVLYPTSHSYYYPLSWYRSYWGYNSPQVVYSGPWYGNDPFVTQGQNAAQQAQQAQQQSQPPREPTAVEKAEIAWRSGRVSESVRWFREYLDKAPEDADAMRYLSMALVDDRKVEQAVAVMAMAYQKDPKLAARPMPRDVLPGGEPGLRKRLNTVSTYANRVRTASGWLTLAVLMQAEGREADAARMLERAKAAGLSGPVAEELGLSLAD